MKSLIASLQYKKENLKTYLLLLAAPVLLTLYYYHAYPEYFTEYFPDLAEHPLVGFYERIWQFVVFFLLTFATPALIIKYHFREKFTAYGFGLGDYRYGLKTLAIFVPVIAIIAFFAAQNPDVTSEYPLSKTLFQHHELILPYELSYIIFYYIAWEFFFRGFLLFGLSPKLGVMNAVLIQTISSCLIHLGKPESEILASILAGVLFAALALRTRSIWYPFVLHATLGVLTDLFIIYMN